MRYNKKIGYILVLLIVIATFSNVKAKEVSNLELKLEVKDKTNFTDKTKFKFEFTTDKVDVNPMPEGAIEGKLDIEITGEGTFTIPTINFENVGNYEYYLTQVEGNKDDYEFDNTKHVLKVSGGQDMITKELSAFAFIFKDGDEESKYESFDYINKELPKPEEKPIDTSDINMVFLGEVLVFSIAGLVYFNKRLINN